MSLCSFKYFLELGKVKTFPLPWQKERKELKCVSLLIAKTKLEKVLDYPSQIPLL